MGVEQFVPRNEVVVEGGRRRLLDGWSVVIGVRQQVSTATLMLDVREGTVWPGQPVRSRAGYGFTSRDLFAGEVERPARQLWPWTLSVAASGVLSRCRRGVGIEDPNAYGPPDPTLPPEDKPPAAAAFSNMSDEAIVRKILGLYGITDHDIQGTGQLWATLGPRYLLVSEPGLQLIEELDEITGYKTWDDADGVVRRRPLSGVPATTPARTWVQGVDLLNVTREEDRASVANRVIAKGVNDIGADGVPYTITGEAVAPAAKDPQGRAYIPDPPGRTFDFSSLWLETQAEAQTYAERKLGELNRLTETISADLAVGDNGVRPGMTVAIQSDKVDLSSGSRFWVEEVQYRGQGAHFGTTVQLRGQTTSQGTNPNPPPIAAFTYDVESEYDNTGRQVWVVTFDGTSSTAQAGSITSWAWTGTPVAPTPNTSPATASALYTTDSPAPTVTLTVTDSNGKTASTTRTLALNSKAVRIRDLWLAATTALYLTTDGGKTWQSFTVPAIGCCREAGKDYQLAWTQPGALWRVTTGAVATNVSPAAAITCAWISYQFQRSPDDPWTGVCYAGAADGSIWRSTDSGQTWTRMGAIPGGLTVNDISESPYAEGQVQALAGRDYWFSYDAGVTWQSLYSLPGTEPGIVALRLAAGFDQQWIGYNGVPGAAAGMIKERSGKATLDLPSANRPANVAGLQLGVTQDTLYLLNTDGTNTTTTWVGDASVGGTLAQKTWQQAAWGPGRDMVRDGRFQGLLYVAGEKMLVKTPDEFTTWLALKGALAGETLRMVGFGALKGLAAAGAFIASVWVTDTTTANSAIIRLTDKGWEFLSAAPNIWNASIAGTPHRPLLKVSGTIYLTWALSSSVGDVFGGVNAFNQLNNVARSTDGGKTWTVLGAPLYGVTAIAVADDGVLYATAGMTGETRWGTRVLKSTDNGATWVQVRDNSAVGGDAGQQGYSAVGVVPGNSAIVAVRCGSNVAISTNGGTTWQVYTTLSDYAGTWQSSGLIGTSDGQIVWTRADSGNNIEWIYRVVPTTGAATQGTTTPNVPHDSRYPGLVGYDVVLYRLANGANSVLRSVDNGATWNGYYDSATQNPGGRAVPGANGLVVDPTSGAIYIGHEDTRNIDSTKPPVCFVGLKGGANVAAAWEDLTPAMYSKLGKYYICYRGGMQPL